MAAATERTEECPLVGLEEQVANVDRHVAARCGSYEQRTLSCPSSVNEPPLTRGPRSRIVKVSALTVLVAVGSFVAAVAVSTILGRTHREIPVEQADSEGITRLDVVQPSLIDVQVATSTQAFAETASSVSVAFMVNGVWSNDQELFPKAEEGQVNTASAMVPARPAAVRLRINGNDGWGYKYIRMSYGGVSQSILESLNGKPYGNNEYWLDGDQDMQRERVFAVPPSAQTTTSRSNLAARLLLFLLLLILIAAVVAYIFRDHFRKYMPGANQANMGQIPGQLPPAMVSHQGLLSNGASPVPGVQTFESNPMVSNPMVQ